MKRISYLIFIYLFLITPVFSQMNIPANELVGIHQYISQSWSDLKRSALQCEAIKDKLTITNNIIYIPYGFNLSRNERNLITSCGVNIESLPKKIDNIGDLKVADLLPGLLYLPKPYVVPGGMFNEMYGWDSFFIIIGLLADQQIDTAQDMLENFFFEVKYYGGILNANRSYFLSRSQPPFLTAMIRAVYSAKKTQDLVWLATAYNYSVKVYNFWTSGQHLAGDTGLSRYYDFEAGPVPEMKGPDAQYYKNVKHELGATSLNQHFFAGDRAMRESGFDTSFRFGAFSGHTTDYAPVDLNSLLYQAEKDLAWMSRELNHPQIAAFWEMKARSRLNKINQYLWNETKGLYFDYNFKNKQQSTYIFATTYYPLWVKAASAQQAKKLLDNLPLLERKGGLLTSTFESGAQWDAPYGWAPLQYIAIKGLYNYHYKQDAERITNKFLKMVLDNYKTDKTIHEKYDVVRAKSQTAIKFGYSNNVVGFGWTNGVFLALL